jgi:hypothetical protein
MSSFQAIHLYEFLFLQHAFFFKKEINLIFSFHIGPQLQNNYSDRERSIKRCIDILAGDVLRLKEEKAAQPDDLNLHKRLRQEQMSLRVLRTELCVEEVVKERTMKVFHERCRDFYKP